MFSFIRRVSDNIIHKSTYIHQEPVNRVSLIILILIDIFVLFNVFSGLANISQWPLNPSEEVPCFFAYQSYQTAKNKGSFELKTATIEAQIQENKQSPKVAVETGNRLGKVSPLCANKTSLSKAVTNPETSELKVGIDRLRTQISSLEREINTLRSQYDSALLEKIAGQPRQQSINKATADQIKTEIDKNKTQIANKQKEIAEKQTKLIQHPASDAYLQLLNNTSEYGNIKKVYESAEFWYPNKQLILQVIFLLPLIAVTYIWHSVSIGKNRGLQSLLSWHLLLIFCIPLLIKFFEFIQFGNIVSTLIALIVSIFGGLLFIASYAFILVIPLFGFGLIKILQIWVFNPRVQAKKRIQKVRCIHCNAKLRLSDEFCPYCGFDQYVECSNCQQKTYKFIEFCSTCGHKLEQNQ
jgi:hypothetical protein